MYGENILKRIKKKEEITHEKIVPRTDIYDFNIGAYEISEYYFVFPNPPSLPPNIPGISPPFLTS
jgi:hypothetical protein